MSKRRANGWTPERRVRQAEASEAMLLAAMPRSFAAADGLLLINCSFLLCRVLLQQSLMLAGR